MKTECTISEKKEYLKKRISSKRSLIKVVFCYQYQATHKIVILQGQLHIVQQVSDQLQLHKFGGYYPCQDIVLLNRAVCNVYHAIWQNNLDSFSIISTKRMGNHRRKDAVFKNINITSQTSIKKK